MGIIADSNSHLTEVNMSLIYLTQRHPSVRFGSMIMTNHINITPDMENTAMETDPSGGFTHFNSYDLNATTIPGYEFDQWIETLNNFNTAHMNQITITYEGPLFRQVTN